MKRPALPFIMAYVLPFATFLGLLGGGWWTFAGVFFLLVLTPFLDQLLGLETWNPSASEELERQREPLFDLWLWLWVPCQLGLQGFGLWVMTAGAVTPLEVVGFCLSTGIITGAIGITTAHELVHRPSVMARASAEVLMSAVAYPHFCLEHVHGHHRHVATPLDPASARLGEGLYRFLPRSILGGLRSAWRIEAQRCQASGTRPWSLANRRLRYPLVQLALIGIIGALAGPLALLFFLAQAFVAVLLLEVINYIEHYGLQRREQAPGRYERVSPRHSWNSPHRLTSLYLFNLTRHADHHALASRPYYNLRHIPDSPQLPAGYAAMLLLAFIPPLWRRVMDSRAGRFSWPSGEVIDEGRDGGLKSLALGEVVALAEVAEARDELGGQVDAEALAA